MRKALSIAVTAVLASAAVAGAAPAKGVTWSDARGDADFANGAASAASQAAYDIVRVRLSPKARTRTTAGIVVRIELAAPAATTPGTAFYLSGIQDGCDFTVTRAATADGWTDSSMLKCPATPGHGAYQAATVRAGGGVNGKTVTFAMPDNALLDHKKGAKITGIEVGTALADPVVGVATPLHADTAPYSGTYVLGR
jgi:hypothetical protein